MLWAALSSVVGGVLLVAGLPKVRDRERMVRVVRGYKMLPDGTSAIVGTILPWVEIALGLALILGPAPSITGTLTALLFAAFFTGLTVNLIRGRRELDCGCFAFGGGAEEIEHIGWWHSARAAAFALAGIATMMTPQISALDRLGGAGIGLFALVLVCVGLYVRSFMSFGRRPIDDYLTNAAIEMRAVSSISRY